MFTSSSRRRCLSFNNACDLFHLYVDIAVIFLISVNFVFPLFLGMAMNANEFQTKEEQKIVWTNKLPATYTFKIIVSCVAGLLFSIAACGVVKSRDKVTIFFLQVKLSESVVGQKTGYKNSYSSTSIDILDWVCKSYLLLNFDM